MAKESKLYLALMAVCGVALIWLVYGTIPKPEHTADWYCHNRLREIDSDKQQWALEWNKTAKDAPPTWKDLRPYLSREMFGDAPPECPAHGVYTYGRVGEKASCSIHGTTPDP